MIIYPFISLLLDGITSNVKVSFLLPLFSILSIIIIYPFFKDKFKYFLLCGLLGLLYDILYSDIFIQYLIIFTIISFIIHLFNKLLVYNILNVLILSIVTIIFFRLITYIFYLGFNNGSFSFLLFIESIYNSLLINIIYILLSYYLFDYLNFKKKLKKY